MFCFGLSILPSWSPWNFPCDSDESRNHLLFLNPYSLLGKDLKNCFVEGWLVMSGNILMPPNDICCYIKTSTRKFQNSSQGQKPFRPQGPPGTAGLEVPVESPYW